MRQTPWIEYREHGHTYRIRAEYGWHQIGTQEPYWSATGTIERLTGRGWRDDAGGMIHEEIAAHFPALAPTLKWHGSFVRSGPMHYVANARYWLEQHYGVSRWSRRSYDPDPLEAFKRVVVFGAVASDQAIPTLDALDAWCAERLPALIAAMTAETNAVLALTEVPA